MRVKLTFYPKGSMRKGCRVYQRYWIAETWLKRFRGGYHKAGAPTLEGAIEQLYEAVHATRMREHEAKQKPKVTWIDL